MGNGYAFGEPRYATAGYLVAMMDGMDDGNQIRFAKELIAKDGLFASLAERDPSDCEKLRMLCAAITDPARSLPSPRLLSIIHSAVQPLPSPISEQDMTRNTTQQPPHWPTGCNELDMMTRGGYSQAVIAGTAKLGKSMLAMGSAISAAMTGWKVAYLGGENSEHDNRAMFDAYLYDESVVVKAEVLERFRLFNVLDRGFSIAHCVSVLEDVLSDDVEISRLLIVIDSVNRIAELTGKPGESEARYFKIMNEWSDFFRRASWRSSGNVSSLLVSEMNQDHSTKGRRLEYAANLVIALESVKNEPDMARLSVSHSRSTKAGSLGIFHRDWPTRRFIFQRKET